MVLGDVYRQHYGGLLRLAWLLTGGDTQAAEDLVHDAFASLQPRLYRLRDPQAVVSYLRVSLINRSRTRFRRRVQELQLLQSNRVEPVGDFQDDLVNADMLAQMLAMLPRRQRQTVALRYWCDLSVEETSLTLGISPGTVKSNAAKGLNRLRRLLEGVER